jgi:hypothetical protein
MPKKVGRLCRLIVVSTLALSAATICPVASSVGASAEIGARGSGSSLTPSPGSAVRKAVLDALRQEIKRIHGLEVVFVVGHLKVKGRWAWVQARPQSADGASQYEDVSALFLNRDGAWEVAEMPCAEVDNPDCLDAPDYFTGLKRRFPDIPSEILPPRPEGARD